MRLDVFAIKPVCKPVLWLTRVELSVVKNILASKPKFIHYLADVMNSVTRLGDVWKFLGTNFHTKVAQMLSGIFGLLFKLLWIHFGQLLEKFGLLFTSTTGHLGNELVQPARFFNSNATGRRAGCPRGPMTPTPINPFNLFSFFAQGHPDALAVKAPLVRTARSTHGRRNPHCHASIINRTPTKMNRWGMDWGNCDQIGRFFKVLGNKFDNKSSP